MLKNLGFCLAMLIACSSFAQQGTSSPYSFFGIGSLKFKGTVENRSMGGLSIFSDSIHVNLRNPASFAGNNLQLAPFNNESRPVTFALGGEYNSNNLKTDNNSDDASTTTFDYMALSFPVGKFGVGFGLIPYTAVGYKLNSEEVINDETVVTERYSGSGGLNRSFLSLGYQLSENFSVGIESNYNFGNINNSSIDFVFDDEGDPLQYQSRETNSSQLRGFDFNFGLRYTPMINDKLQLTAAATYSPESKINSDNERTFATIVINETTGQELEVNEIDADLQSQNLKETKLTLPAKTSFGLGIGKPRKWFIGAEYTFLQTSSFSNRIFDIENTTFENASTFALGGFYIPQYTSFNRYLKRVVYRAGARFENTGLKINNESINEFGISFGVGLPVGRLFSNVNLGFELGRRGTTSQGLVQENFVTFQLSLSLNDRWFVKRKFN
ncbi:MAG: hypothetical protein HKO90_02730 [Flavobacteriaceae bacterium]|nr:hypothetical protein [Flavobacteriaceae bacterium]